LRKSLHYQKRRAEDLEAKLEEALHSSDQLGGPKSSEPRATAPRGSGTSSSGNQDEAVVPAEPERGLGVAAPTVSARSSPIPPEALPENGEAAEAVNIEEVSFDPAQEDEEDPASECQVGLEAAREAEQEAQRMRLFRCPFAQAIDLTATRRRPVGPPGQSKQEDDDKHLGSRQLRSFISEVYSAKRLEDRRRDKTKQPRRPLHAIMQEILRRQHGVKRLVHQRSWQLLESVAMYAFKDVAVGLFADFLDGTRDLDELSFYLYCSSLLASTICEESQATPPSKLPQGFVSRARAERLVELLFSDMPKALEVVREEFEKLGPSFYSSSMSFNPSFEDISPGGSFYGSAACVEADSLSRALLEGWRVCSLLLNKSTNKFLWQAAVTAFIQADIHLRGWLDPHEVRSAEITPALSKSCRSAEVPLGDQTSLGAFVFRIVQGFGADLGQLQDPSVAIVPTDARGRRQEVISNRCLQVCSTAFGSLERSLGVYLSWLVHSEEPRDKVVYQSVKSRIFGYRRADSVQQTWPMIHNLRCLLVLLLAHQFDIQLAREEASPEHLAWELTALLQILRESWRTGASLQGSECGPEFGPELEEVGETNRDQDQKGPVTFSEDA